MIKRLAVIDSIKTSIRSHGMLRVGIDVAYEGPYIDQACLGCHILDDATNNDDAMNHRIGTAYGCEMIRQILLTLEIDDFSEAKGINVWVYGEGEGISFVAKGISLLSFNSPAPVVLMFDKVYALFNGGK